MKHVLETGQVVFDSWYATPEGQRFMARTNGGQTMFTWEAVYSDGKIVRQFPEIEFNQAINNRDYTPPDEARVSVNTLDKNAVVKFNLYPSAVTRQHAPWFQRPVTVQLRPWKGEYFLNYWLTDRTPATGYELRRHVVGMRKVVEGVEFRSLTVISPSGKITICADDNVSYEGE